MKQLSLWLIGLLAVAGSAFGQMGPVPQFGVNPNSVISSLPTRANAYAKEIWISNRLDALGGSGTEFDPLYGGLDAGGKPSALETFFITTLPALGTGVHVHFMAGTFLTYGSSNNFSAVAHGYNLPAGNWYQGSGKGITTLKSFAAPDSHQWYVWSTSSNASNDYVKISDMTIDPDWNTLDSGTAASIANCVAVYGSYCTIDNCEFLHWHGDVGSGLESFPVGVAGPTIATVVQPITGIRITNSTFRAPYGNYGGGCVVFDVQASTSQEAGAIIMGNDFHDIVADATHHNTQCIGMTGDGFIVANNYANNVDKFWYSEGPVKNLSLTGNQVRNCSLCCINLNDTTNNVFQNINIENNSLELNTSIITTSAGTKSAINISCNTNPTYFVFANNTVGYRVAGAATSTHARNGSNVATIVTAAPHGLATNDRVEITGMTDSTFNTTYAQITKVDNTTFTYSNTGGTVGTAADTTGTVGTTAYGLVISSSGSQANSHVTCTNNYLDDRFYSIFSYSASVDMVWYGNLTFSGAPLQLAPSLQHSLPSTVTFPAMNDAASNGSNLVKAYAHAALINPNSAAASATNRVTVAIDNGNYTLTDGALIASANFIDLIGKGQRDGTILTSAGSTLTINSGVSDIRLAHFTLNTTLNATVGSSDTSTKCALFTNSAIASARFEDLAFTSTGSNNTVRGGQNWGGTYVNCHFASGGFFGQGQGTISGLVLGCDNIGATADTNNFYVTGVLRGCDFRTRCDLYRNDGLIDQCTFKPATAVDACYTETANGGSGTGVFTRDKFLHNGAGKTMNANAAQTYAIAGCFFDADANNITDSVNSPNNVVSTSLSQ